MNKFAISVNSVDANGKAVFQTLSIIVNPPKKDRTWNKWISTFSLKIPAYIWSGLAGREIPYRGKDKSVKDTQRYSFNVREFPKTITRQTLREVVEDFERLVADYRFALQLDKAFYEKVIFYELGSKSSPFTAAWVEDHELGKTSQASFNYAIGYVLELPKTTDSWGDENQEKYRYDAYKRIVPRYQNEKFHAMKYVKWTEKRQLFFDRLQASFDLLRDRIDTFESQISETKIDQLVAGQMRLLEETYAETSR